MLVSDAGGFEGKAHAVNSSFPVEKQPLIGLELNEENAAQVCNSEPSLQRALAQLKGIVVFANQLEVLLKFRS